ncbi:MAG: sigma-70 family RNA polymerase sigma factor [Polyangiales bacterium]
MRAESPDATSSITLEPVSTELKKKVDAAFRHYESRLFHAALRITRNEDDAWDAVQEGMINALRHADRFRGDAAVASWLYSIVVNAALYQCRRGKARRRHHEKYGERVWPEAERSLEAGTAVRDPEAFALARIALSRAAAQIEALTPDRRRLIELSMGGDTAAEIAAEAHEPVTAVKSRLWRTRATLRQRCAVA